MTFSKNIKIEKKVDSSTRQGADGYVCGRIPE